MTSLTREHGAEQDFDAFAATVAAFGEVFDRTPAPPRRRSLAWTCRRLAGGAPMSEPSSTATAEVPAERVHVTRSRAKPGGTAAAAEARSPSSAPASRPG